MQLLLIRLTHFISANDPITKAASLQYFTGTGKPTNALYCNRRDREGHGLEWCSPAPAIHHLQHIILTSVGELLSFMLLLGIGLEVRSLCNSV